jgi:hypothetical protein
MKRAFIAAALLLAGAGYLYMQTTASAPPLAARMPGGALLYLEAPNFDQTLRDWDGSAVKSAWLNSANYATFSRSNLFLKLQEVYGQYGAAAGFEPGLKSILEIAGTDSALALYGIRDVEFLYISRVPESALTRSELWALRDKFQQRQAGGVPFYLRIDPASHRTVAFAFVQGYLLLATRDDLMAQSLELFAGTSNPSVATDRWYREAAATAGRPGELRLVMNLESLVKSTYFHSYWVERNSSQIARYWTGIADVRRTPQELVDTRSFLRVADQASATPANVSNLLALVPPQAGVYKAWQPESPEQTAALVVARLIGPPPQQAVDWRFAPGAAMPDAQAGTEADLETRIDEPPLPQDPGFSGAVAALAKLNIAGPMLLVEASAPVGGPFVRMPTVVVLQGQAAWNRDTVRDALSTAAGDLWTTAQLGAGWTSATAGRHSVDRLDGLGTLTFAIAGQRLFLANDLPLLAAVLDRTATAPSARPMTYAAGFRHSRESANYGRIMTALDFGSAHGETPAFFSGDLASLGRTLASISESTITRTETNSATEETVSYHLR